MRRFKINLKESLTYRIRRCIWNEKIQNKILKILQNDKKDTLQYKFQILCKLGN